MANYFCAPFENLVMMNFFVEFSVFLGRLLILSCEQDLVLGKIYCDKLDLR